VPELGGLEVTGLDGRRVDPVGGLDFCGVLALGVVVLDDGGGLGAASSR
jgi:hypothetical protein